MLLNEQPLIFDCGFADTMNKFETRDAVRQFKHSFSFNRIHRQPFVLHLCNVDRNSLFWHEMLNQMSNIEKLPLNIHTVDATEVFPKEKLVYLSPDSENVLNEFNSDHYYIIGTIVDKGSQRPFTFAKSKRFNIQTTRLPLEKHIRLHSHASLTLDQITNILLEIKTTRNWQRALKHMPDRKRF